jgi:hypothetical protein
MLLFLILVEDIQLQKYRKLGRDINRNVEKLQKLGYRMFLINIEL